MDNMMRALEKRIKVDEDGAFPNIRAQRFELILYEDCPEHMDFIHELKGHSLTEDEYSVISGATFIRHDKDIKEDGTLKKPHYHVLLDLRQRYRVRQIAKILNLELQAFARVKNYVRAMRYLIHLDDLDKYQYEPSEVQTYEPADIVLFNRCINSDCPVDDLAQLDELYQIACMSKSYNMLLQYAMSHGSLSTLRKYYMQLRDCIREFKEK